MKSNFRIVTTVVLGFFHVFHGLFFYSFRYSNVPIFNCSGVLHLGPQRKGPPAGFARKSAQKRAPPPPKDPEDSEDTEEEEEEEDTDTLAAEKEEEMEEDEDVWIQDKDVEKVSREKEGVRETC